MRVLTLRQPDFDRAVDALTGLVSDQPDFIVGILEGGGHVGRRMAKNFGIPAERYFEISLQRPSSKRKGGRISALLRRLPLWALDAMRIVEARWLALFPERGERSVELPQPLVEALRKGGLFLVTDDAVDSGSTLRTVLERMRSIGPTPKVASAVITVTTSRPAVRPDYALYDNRTLIRFPWSKDAR